MAEPLSSAEFDTIRRSVDLMMCTDEVPVKVPYYLVKRLVATIIEAQRMEAVTEARLNSSHDVIRWLADGHPTMNEDAQEEYMLATGQDPLA